MNIFMKRPFRLVMLSCCLFNTHQNIGQRCSLPWIHFHHPDVFVFRTRKQAYIRIAEHAVPTTRKSLVWEVPDADVRSVQACAFSVHCCSILFLIRNAVCLWIILGNIPPLLLREGEVVVREGCQTIRSSCKHTFPCYPTLHSVVPLLYTAYRPCL